jgi:hypothetical protein
MKVVSAETNDDETGSEVSLVQAAQGGSWNSDASFSNNTVAGDYVIGA